jgi:hypothetical protein
MALDRFRRADRVSWFGAAARQTTRTVQETRFSSQHLPHPGNPPEQPDYLGRHRLQRQIGSDTATIVEMLPDHLSRR